MPYSSVTLSEGTCAAYHTLRKKWPTPLLTEHLLIALTHIVLSKFSPGVTYICKTDFSFVLVKAQSSSDVDKCYIIILNYLQCVHTFSEIDLFPSQ